MTTASIPEPIQFSVTPSSLVSFTMILLLMALLEMNFVAVKGQARGQTMLRKIPIGALIEEQLYQHRLSENILRRSTEFHNNMTSQFGFIFDISEANMEDPKDGFTFVKEMCNLIGQGIVILILGLRPHSPFQELHSFHLSRFHHLPQISMAYPPRRNFMLHFNRPPSLNSREEHEPRRDSFFSDFQNQYRFHRSLQQDSNKKGFNSEPTDSEELRAVDENLNPQKVTPHEIMFHGMSFRNNSPSDVSPLTFRPSSSSSSAPLSSTPLLEVMPLRSAKQEKRRLDRFRKSMITNTKTSSSSSSSSSSAAAAAAAATEQFVFYMRPPVLKAVKDVVNYYRWKKIYYVYDHSEGLANIELLTSIKPSPYSTLPTLTTPTRQHLVTALEIHPIRIVTPSKCHVVLRNMDARQLEGDKHVILDVTDDNILQLIFRQFQNVGMNRLNYHYLVAGLSISQMDLSDFKYGGANITGFRLVNGNVSFSLENGLLADSMSVLSRGMIKYVEGDGSAASLNKRLRFSNHDKRRSQCFESPSKAYRGMPFNARESLNIANSMRGVTFTGYTGQVSFDRYGVRKNFKLDLMEMVVDNELEKIGEWDSNRGLQITKKVDLSATSPVLKTNKTRIVTTIESKPYIMIKKQPDDPSVLLEGNDRFEGFAADLADKVADLVGFEYRIELVKDMKYGERMSDGTWNGMVGELTRKEADLAIAPLTITSIRERVIDFSKPFMSLGISIMIKKPEKQKPGVFSFMEPLSHSIWYCIVISYLGVSLVLFLVSRFSPNEWQIEEASYEGRLTFTNDFTLLNSLWFSLGAFMRRGCDVCPRSLSGRIVGSAWWFFTLIIISSYTANLAAFLTVERMLTPINGADDLAKQKEILYGTVDSGSTKEFFKTSKIPTYEKMWLFMNSEPSVFAKTTDEGVQKVRNSKGKYAFLMESTMNDYYNQRKPCNTMKVGGNLDSKGYGIGTYIGSDLRDKINVAVLQLLEQEKLQKLQKKWWYDKGQCIIETDSKSGSKQSSLSLSNVAGIFYILIGGLGLSLVVASLEFLCKSHRDLKQKKFYVTASMSSAVSGNFDKSPYQTHIPSSAVGFRPLMVSSSSETYKPLSSHTLV